MNPGQISQQQQQQPIMMGGIQPPPNMMMPQQQQPPPPPLAQQQQPQPQQQAGGAPPAAPRGWNFQNLNMVRGGGGGSPMVVVPSPPPPPHHHPSSVMVKVGRVHHTMSPDELSIHAFQLGIAQQIASLAQQQGVEPVDYQAGLAVNHYGLDPRILPEMYTSVGPRRLDGTEVPLGLMLIKDEGVYSHIELVTRYPRIAAINFTPVDPDPKRAAFFLTTCQERLVHESIKYGHWAIPAEGANRMNVVFGEMLGMGPVYLLFASTDSLAFSGIAEMVGPAVPPPGMPHAPKPSVDNENGGGDKNVESTPPAGEGVTTTTTATTATSSSSPSPVISGRASWYRFPVRWIYCKNVPFSHMQHVALRTSSPAAEEQRRLHGGLVPMVLRDGIRALQIMQRHHTGSSTLMDFKYYDDAEANGIIAESGDASVRAAIRFQQNAGRHHHGGGGQRGQQQQQQQHGGGGGFANASLPRRAPQQMGFQQQQQQQQPRGVGNNNNMGRGPWGVPPSGPLMQQNRGPVQFQAGGGNNNMFPHPGSGNNNTNNNRGGMGMHPRGGSGGGGTPQMRMADPVPPPRRVETSNGEKVQLTNTFSFEPVRKMKQKHSANKRKSGQGSVEETTDAMGKLSMGEGDDIVAPPPVDETNHNNNNVVGHDVDTYGD